ncbi:cytochrome P450 71A1-like [Cucurbita maxima]|uniref:Cytochrome P450 71A1-like n=1 Tax=Cucurbita maxima TaxID=3661 RepID=A0A6J1KR44_CUCMA|nr:cytochrome P450 71A1-like [Cucurbita maxima]
MAREVMKTHDLKFSNRPKTTATNLLFYGCQDMGFAPYGAYWRRARKMCVLELFSFKRVESFQYIRDEEVGVLISRIHKACAGGEVVNLSKLFLQISNNVVSRCVMGKKFEDENGNNRFRDVSRRVIELLSAFCVADFFPAFGWVDVVRGFIGELKTISKTMDEFLDRVIEEHKTELRTGKPDDKRDFLDIMLQLNQDIMLDYHFTPDNLKAILQDMFAGGSDTSATALEWAMAELIRNPNTLKKVQEEIRTIVGKKPKIEMLKYHH